MEFPVRETDEYIKDLIKRTFNQDDPSCGVYCPDEWKLLVTTLIQVISSYTKRIQKIYPEFKLTVAQVKSKFGGLRFYIDVENDSDLKGHFLQWLHEIYGAIDMAEAYSFYLKE